MIDIGKLLSDPYCIRCNRKALEHCHSEAGKKEVFISGLCEECFDELFKEEDKCTELSNANACQDA